MKRNGQTMIQKEQNHLLRVDALTINRSGNEGQKLRVIEETRGWTLAEIAVSDEEFAPRRLAHSDESGGSFRRIRAPLVGGRVSDRRKGSFTP